MSAAPEPVSGPDPLIEARQVSKRFGRAVALSDVDLALPAGTSLAVVGPNGAGKSTLLRLLAGLARPSAGELRIAGVRADRPAARGRVGLVGHETFLYPALTARENLIFAGRLHGLRAPGERADALLAEAQLTQIADRQAGTLSRGMAQRLSIARGLVHDPEVLLLDEPFSGLDRHAASALAARLAALRTARRTLLLVTHDLTRAAELADSALVLAGGRVAFASSDARGDLVGLERAYARAAGSDS